MQSRQRFIDAQHGAFVGMDVEVAYRMMYQLQLSVYMTQSLYRRRGTYGGRILIEQHSEIRRVKLLRAEEIDNSLDFYRSCKVNYNIRSTGM